MIKIHYPNLIRQTLPPLKRTPVRLAWFNALLSALIEMYNEFQRWAELQRMLINVNGRTMVLEGFLRFKYGNTEIAISTTIDNLPGIGLVNEGDIYIALVGLLDETAKPFELPLISERQGGEYDVDFVVFVPAGVNVNDVIADIERYKTPLATYNLVADLHLIDSHGHRITDSEGRDLIITKQTGYL